MLCASGVQQCSGSRGGARAFGRAAFAAAASVLDVLALPDAEAMRAACSDHSMSRVTVCKHVSLPSSAQRTWHKVGDFCPANHWSPDIVRCELMNGDNNVVGVVRRLSLRNGGSALEQLVARDAASRTLSYTIVESGLPVVNYRATLAVRAEEGGGATVEWSCTFAPASGTDSDTARRIVEEIYEIGLSGLRSALSDG